MSAALKRLRIDRVDFVDKGANPGALITLAKRATKTQEQGMTELPEDVAKRMADQSEAIEALTKRADTAEAKQKETEAFQKAAEDALAVEIAKREATEAEGIAKGLVLPGVTEKTVFIQKVKHALGADWPAMEAVLKALSVADRTSAVFTEKGSDMPVGQAPDGYDRLNEMAEALVAKGTHTNRAHALDAVLKSPEGKAEYQKYVATKTRRN